MELPLGAEGGVEIDAKDSRVTEAKLHDPPDLVFIDAALNRTDQHHAHIRLGQAVQGPQFIFN